jgi:signal peptidase II
LYGLQAKGGTTLNLIQRKWLAITALIVLVLDYSTKTVALNNLSAQPKQILGTFLQLRLTFNSGAAFSLASSGTIFLSSFAIIVSVAILYYGRKVSSKQWAFGLGLALGGIFGNLSDRIFRPPGGLQGKVVDWIQLPNWPVFNVADMAVVSAAFVITYLSWKSVPISKNRDI